VDEYEEKFMSEGGLVYQTKSRAPLGFHLLVAAPALFSLLILGFVSMQPGVPATTLLAAIPTFLILLPIWLLFSVLRATVTRRHVHIQYGLFGPKIPLEAILGCEAVTYDWKKYGGWGIRRARDGSWAYNMMGDQGRAVRIQWRDSGGKTVTTLLSSPDPDGFVRAVAKARAAAEPPKVRVATGASEVELREAERELEAELEAEKHRSAGRGRG
jgi:hypothetical protein